MKKEQFPSFWHKVNTYIAKKRKNHRPIFATHTPGKPCRIAGETQRSQHPYTLQPGSTTKIIDDKAL